MDVISESKCVAGVWLRYSVYLNVVLGIIWDNTTEDNKKEIFFLLDIGAFVTNN